MKLSVGRPRSAGRRDLPDNLIPRPRTVGDRTVVYWYWRDPRDGLEKPLKCPDDRSTAIRRAKELNAIVAQDIACNLVSGIVSPKVVGSTPFDAFAVHYLRHIETRGLAENTLRTRKSLVNAGIRWFKSRSLESISEDVPEVTRFIKSYTDQGKNRYAQAIRSCLMDMWKLAYEEGILKSSSHPDPAAITRRPEAKVSRARLVLETFNSILESAYGLAETRGQWIPNSQLLALVTAQRREDLAIAQFRRGRDWIRLWQDYQDGGKSHPYPHVHEGYFWVVQQKTGALVRIPIDLRLEAIGLSVGEVIDRCRSKIASRFLLHHTIPFGNAPLGSRIHKDSISHAFAHARDSTDLTWSKSPPTYHEIRSLSERLYKAQGIDTKALLGHKHAKMTDVYDDPRQAEWITL